MRFAVWTIIAGTLAAGALTAQSPVAPPPMIAGAPAAILPPPPLPAPVPNEPPPAPPDGFAVGTLPPGVIVSPPAVRPPMPVPGAPIEIPPGPMYWVAADYLLWRSKGGMLPPLVIAANTNSSLDPRVIVPLSDERINGDLQSGVRLEGGLWLDKPHGMGVEVICTSFLGTGDIGTYAGNSNAVIGRPFVDVNRPGPALLRLSSTTGSMQGVAQVRTTFDSDGFELNWLPRGPAMIGEEMHWIVGARYFGLEESLTVESVSQSGTMRVGTFDTFATRNQFYGAQVGGMWNFTRGNFSINLIAKMAIGAMHQEVDIQGGTSVVLPSGTRIDRSGGLLALSSNIGEYDRTRLVVIRDTAINVSYCLTPNISLRLGYDFMWVSSVVRPGDQIDLGVNPTLMPFGGATPRAPLRPAFHWNGDIYWMHGVSVGIAVQF